MTASTIKGALKGASVFLALVGAVAALHFLGLDDSLDTAWVDAHIRDHGVQGYVLFIALAAFLTSLAVPRQFVAFLGGYAFGVGFGTLWATVGVTCGCVLSFFYARFAGQAFVRQRFGKRVAKINAFLSHNPFTMSVVIRCLPVGNNLLTNLIAGVSSISPLRFFAGSFAGYIPQHFIFALLGSGINVSPVWRTVVSSILFVASLAVGYMLYRKFRVESTLAEPNG